MPAKEKKRGRDKQSNAKAKGQIAVPTGGAKRKIEVLYCCDLKYAAPPSFYEVTIAQCAREGCSTVEDKSDATKVFKCCGQLCGTRYCSRECQVKDWKKGKHKKLCPLIKEIADAGEWSRKEVFSEGASTAAAAAAADNAATAVTAVTAGDAATSSIVDDPALAEKNEATKSDGNVAWKHKVSISLLRRVRDYAVPFALHHTSLHRYGVLFCQSKNARLCDFCFHGNRSRDGRDLNRDLRMDFLSLEDWAELKRKNFEMNIAEIDALLPDSPSAPPSENTYDPQIEILVVMIFQDGNMVAMRVPFEDILHRLVAAAMADMFEGKPNTIQLNLDARD